MASSNAKVERMGKDKARKSMNVYKSRDNRKNSKPTRGRDQREVLEACY